MTRTLFQEMAKKKKKKNNKLDKRTPNGESLVVEIFEILLHDSPNLSFFYLSVTRDTREISYFDFVPISRLKCQMLYVGRELLVVALHGCLSDVQSDHLEKLSMFRGLFFSFWSEGAFVRVRKRHVKLTFLEWYRGIYRENWQRIIR